MQSSAEFSRGVETGIQIGGGLKRLRIDVLNRIERGTALIVSRDSIEIELHQLHTGKTPRAKFGMYAVNRCFHQMKRRLVWRARLRLRASHYAQDEKRE